LDVVCGSGWALALAQALGWQVAGIEMDGPAAEKARRFTDDIYMGGILSAAFEPGRFDVVTAFHVLEHVPDPIAVVRRMLDWLAPAGLLIIEVPNAGGLGARLYGRSWLPLDLPRHLSHFTTESLASALEKAGSHVIWCWHRAKPRDYARNFRRWLRDRGWNWLARFTERRSVYGILKLFLELTLPVVCWAGQGEVIRIGVVPRRD
jgi:SAM-dependent methyltransferase